MCFDYLLLGHLLGDFTFQTDKIAENKTKQWEWNLFHSAIVTFCILFFAVPFGSFIMSMVFLNGILHFFIDYFKVKLPCKNSLRPFIYFIYDQIIHVAIIFFISSFYRGDLNPSLISKEQADFLIVLILISSFASVVIQYVLRLIFVSHNESFYIGNEKIAGIITRVLIFFILYFSKFVTAFILLIVAAVLTAKVIYFNRKLNSLMVPAYFYTGLLMDLLIPVTAFYYMIT